MKIVHNMMEIKKRLYFDNYCYLDTINWKTLYYLLLLLLLYFIINHYIKYMLLPFLFFPWNIIFNHTIIVDFILFFFIDKQWWYKLYSTCKLDWTVSHDDTSRATFKKFHIGWKVTELSFESWPKTQRKRCEIARWKYHQNTKKWNF